MKPSPEWGSMVVVPPAAARGTPLRDLLTQAFRDRYRIGIAFAACMLITVLVSLVPSKKYTSETALLLRLGREYIYTPEVGDAQGGSPVAYDREQTLMAEARILSSRDIKERVIDKLGLAKIYPHLADGEAAPRREAAVVAFERNLQADLLKGSNLLQVSFTHPNPQIAAQVLSELIDAYLAKRAVIFASAGYGTAEADFVKRTIQLNAAEERIAALKQERGIRAFGEEQTLLLAQRNAIEVRKADAALSLSQSASRAQALRDSLTSVAGDVMLSSETQRSEAADSARKTLLDLRLKERDLSARFAETHPMVQDVRNDISRTEEFLRELEAKPLKTQKTGRNPTRDVAESELLRSLAEQRGAAAGAAQLSRQRAEIDQRLEAFANSERELLSLERERRLAEANYEAAAKRLRDELAMEELDRKRRSNVSIVQPPLVPLQGKSIAPLILVVGTILSLCVAALVAFLSALWRDTFLTPEQLERELGIPVLAAVPKRQP
jgi:polysaccharide biosynthesis protein PslE